MAVSNGDVSGLRLSVVKIFVRSASPNFTSPWQMKPQRASTGSGLCIDCERRRILTNSHVISDAVAVRVRRYGDPRLFMAQVICESPQCDLALLQVDDAAFWEGVPAIRLVAETPDLDSDVQTIGYPMGGDNISVTRGVVSRIDLMDYSFSPAGGERLPVIQVDAAINPGNSGGPVLGPSGEAVGVAFAGIKSGENIGYVIPGSVALQFIRGFEETGHFGGLCSLGIRVQATQSKSLRALHGFNAVATSNDENRVREGSGVLIVSVAPLSSAAKAGVKPGDMLLEVEGVSVAEDSSVPFRNEGSGERIGFDYLVTRKMTGESVTLSVASSPVFLAGGSSAGKLRQLQVKAAPLDKLVPRLPGVDAWPNYLIVGGLVFVRLTQPWLIQRFSSVREAPAPLLQKLTDFKDAEESEVVVLAKVLAAEVNYGYEDLQCQQVVAFGAYDAQGASTLPSPPEEVHTEASRTVSVRGLAHLRALTLAAGLGQGASKSSATAFVRFRLADDIEVVIDAAACEAALPGILRQHAIPKECSDDLLGEAREMSSRL